MTSPTNTDILNISFSASTRADARAGAQAFADAYLANRTSTARSFIDAALSSLQKQSRQAQADLKAATDSATQLPPDSPGRAFAQAQQAYLGNVLNTLQNKIITLTTADTTPGRVIQDPQLPPLPVRRCDRSSSRLRSPWGCCSAWCWHSSVSAATLGSTRCRTSSVGLASQYWRSCHVHFDGTAGAVAPPHSALGQAYLRLRNSLVPLTQRSGAAGASSW